MTPPNFDAFQAAFAPYVQSIPGFGFLQRLASGTPMADAPSMTQWVAPVFDVDEIERRIRDLKAVQFWLEQNARALQATIQALEVQKMTLATLKGMNVSLNQVAQAFADAQPSRGPDPQTQAAAAGESAASSATADGSASVPGIDPLRWWRSLTEQFQAIATRTVQEMTQHTAAAAATAMAAAAAAPAAAPSAAPAPQASRGARATRASPSPTDGPAMKGRRGRQAAAAPDGGTTPAPAAARVARRRVAAPEPRTVPPEPPRRQRA